MKINKSLLTAVLSGTASVCAVYFAHSDTKKAEEDKKTTELNTWKDKARFYATHYWRTAACEAVAIGSLVETKKIDGKAIAALTSAAVMLSNQYQELRNAEVEVVDKNTLKKIDEKTLRNSLNASAVDENYSTVQEVYIPYIDDKITVTNQQLLEGELLANERLHNANNNARGVSITEWLDYIGCPTSFLTKKQLKMIKNQGWYMDSPEIQEEANASKCEPWIKHITFFSKSRNCLVLYVETDPVYNPAELINSPTGRFTFPTLPFLRREKYTQDHEGRDHDERQYRYDKLP